MVSNLAGSLALVTCKEPLRVSIGNHMRSLLATAAPNADQSTTEMLVQLCSAENLELGCMLIEKAATEKAMRDIDEAVAPALQVQFCFLVSVFFLFLFSFHRAAYNNPKYGEGWFG